MAGPRTYLDYNASAPLLAEAREAMARALALDGNPSSVHAEGRRLRSVIEDARDAVAALVGARAADVVFTSGATEANVTVLGAGWDTIFLPGIEHDSVLAPARTSGARIVPVPARADGVVDVEAVAGEIAKEPAGFGRALVALQMANNETGVIQPVAEVAALARAHGLAAHTDAVQAAGRIAVDFDGLGVDTLTVSAHKIGGPKGVGALVMRDGLKIPPLVTGGGQERRRRAGTENVAAIAGFGAAARVALDRLAEFGRITRLRDRLEAGLREVTPGAVVFGAGAARLANTCAVGVAGKASEIMVIKLDVAGFAISAGSACSSGKVGVSHVLAAMGADPAAVRGAVRISLGPATTETEVEAFIAAWHDIHQEKGRTVGAQGHSITAGARAGTAARAQGE